MSRNPLLLRACSLAALMGAAGCSLFWDTSEFSRGGEQQQEAPDGSTSNEAGGSSSSIDSDASTPLSDAADAGTHCARLVVAPPAMNLFCEDFEKPNGPVTPLSTTGNGRLSLSDHALRIEIDPLDGGNNSIVPLRRELNVNAKKVHVAFDTKIEKNHGWTNSVALAFSIPVVGEGTKSGVLAFQVGPDHIRVVESVDRNGTNLSYDAHPVIAQTWPSPTPLHIDLTWHENLTFDLVVNGNAVQTARPLATSWGKGAVQLEYGISFANGEGNASMTLDNLSVDAEL